MADERSIPWEQIEELTNRLVETRYPYEVKDILDALPYGPDRVVVVSAALARSVEKGREQGREQVKNNLIKRLGLL